MNEPSRNPYERYMRRAVELAWQGIGRTSPNPMVGCVIVKDGRIIGEGYHLYSKISHAEDVALKQAGDEARGSTVYVSVEPCCHTGRTPPCSTALINAGVAKVVYGMNDPDPRMCGSGIRQLRENGVEVVGGIYEDEIRDQNRFFVTAKEKGRPYILLKWAMTLDGKIATRTGASQWISNDRSRQIVHHLRNVYDAVLVGHNTALTDNPLLTCRLDSDAGPPPHAILQSAPKDIRNPVRIIIDALGATGVYEELRMFNAPGKTIVVVGPRSAWDDIRDRSAIEKKSISLIEVPFRGGHLDLNHLMSELVENKIQSLLVEGGSGIHASFFENQLVDEVCISIGNKIFGGDGAPSPISGGGIEDVEDAYTLDNVVHLDVDGDILVTGRISAG